MAISASSSVKPRDLRPCRPRPDSTTFSASRRPFDNDTAGEPVDANHISLLTRLKSDLASRRAPIGKEANAGNALGAPLRRTRFRKDADGVRDPERRHVCTSCYQTICHVDDNRLVGAAADRLCAGSTATRGEFVRGCLQDLAAVANAEACHGQTSNDRQHDEHREDLNECEALLARLHRSYQLVISSFSPVPAGW